MLKENIVDSAKRYISRVYLDSILLIIEVEAKIVKPPTLKYA